MNEQQAEMLKQKQLKAQDSGESESDSDQLDDVKSKDGISADAECEED